MKKTILFTLIGVSLVLVGCVQQDQPAGDQNIAPTTNQQPTNVIQEELTISYPSNGSTISQSKDMRIKGKTKPGYQIWGYINYSKEWLECLTRNSFANGGAGQADSNGNFDFPMPWESKTKKGKITLVVVALDPNSPYLTNDECFSEENISEVIEFTYTGETVSP